MLVALALALALLAGASYVPLPYYSVSPGSARDVGELIDAPAARRYPARGELLMTTVSMERVRGAEALLAWIDPDAVLVPEDDVLGSTPRREQRRVALEAMDDSKQTAVALALRRLGYTVPEHGEGAVVSEVGDGAPAQGVLHPGDVVVAVDGVPTLLADTAVSQVRGSRPGQVVRVEVQPGDGSARRTVEVRLGRRPGEDGGYLGVSLRTKGRRFELPFPVEIDSDDVGGPSAGLAFALGVIDVLSPGPLTGGQTIAATGTIDSDGNVGEVGGVVQKTLTAREAGAKAFLVPPSEYEAARRHAGGNLQVVKVANLEQALDALGRLGGDQSALGPVGGGRPG